MPDDPKKPAPEETVQISFSLYRSLIVDKIRAEIAAKRAELNLVKSMAKEHAQKVDPNAFGGPMAYWKMAYWKMHYWKRGGHVMVQNTNDPVINPAPGDAPKRK